jgi:hypothetical protein
MKKDQITLDRINTAHPKLRGDLLKIYDENELDQHIKFWSKHLKPTGTLIAHPFNENLSAAIFKKFNELIETDWMIVRQEDNMLFLQRKIIQA